MNRKERTVKINTARVGAWKAMRVVKKFTLEEIEDIAKIKRENLKSYVTFLKKTGYLKITKSGFLLIRDTGVKAPVMVQEVFKHRAYDPNLDAYFEAIKEKRTSGIKNLYLINRLKKAVQKHGQAKVAKMLGFSEATVCLVIKGKYPASTKNIENRVREVL